MNILRRIILLSVASGLVLFGIATVSSVTAQSIVLSEEQKGLIQKNCQTVKNTLNQLHASDALLRVNRGQVYEALSTRLMNNFNSRLANNRLDNKAMVTVASNYQSTLTSFRSSYRLYEEKLSATMKIDCQTDPVKFHESLEDAREKRMNVHDEVKKLNRHVEDYRSAVDDFLLNFERKGE